MARQRRFHSADDKIRILRYLLEDKLSLSDIVKQHGIHPSLVQRWKNILLTKGASAFRHPSAAEISPHEVGTTTGSRTLKQSRSQRIEEDMRWMLALSQGLYDEVFLMGELKGVCQDDIATLLDCIKTKPLKYRYLISASSSS